MTKVKVVFDTFYVYRLVQPLNLPYFS